MPFVKQKEYQKEVGFIGQLPDPAIKPDIPTSEVFSAAFSVDNTLVSGVESFGNGKYMVGKGVVDRDYDPFDDIADTVYQHFPDSFIKVHNKAEADIVKNSIDEELESRRLLEQSGGVGLLATLAAGLFDPINLVPLGAGARVAIKGGSILKGAATAAATGFALEAASEASLQATQETRTLGESAINIGAGTFLSGVLGAGAAGLVRRQQRYDQLLVDTEKDLSVPPITEADTVDRFAQEMTTGSAIDGKIDSVGAARTPDTTLEQESLVRTFGVAKATAFLNPLLRLAHSDSVTARRLSQQLVENPVFFNKNIEGIATDQAIETLRKQYDGALADAVGFQLKQYKLYKRAAKKAGDKKVMNFVDFQEQVAKAMRRNDFSENEFVANVARKFRIKVFTPLKKRAIQEELLPADVDVKTAESYLMRVWDTERIIQHEPEFRNIVSEWVRKTAGNSVNAFKKETNARISKFEADVKKSTGAKLAKLKKQLEDFKIERAVEERMFFDTENNFDSYVDDVTESIIRTLTGFDGVMPTYDIKVAARGPLKERTFNIPDSKVEFFLSNNMERVASRYTRLIGTDVELKGKFKSLTLEEQFQELDDSYRELITNAPTAKERSRLAKRRESDKLDLESMLGIMRGTGKYTPDPSNTWVRAGRLLRIAQYISKLGGVTISSFADAARPVMVHGFARSFSAALPVLVGKVNGVKLSVKEAKLAGQVTETVLNGRLATLAEIADPYAKGTAFERFAQNLSDGFSKVTVMSQWNNFWKATSSIITQNRILDNVNAVSAGKKLSQEETKYMAFLGIDENIARRIGKEFKEFGDKVDNANIANSESWADQALARTYRAALNKDVDRTIVTKGIADVPLFVNSETGKLLLQFRSFALASHQRILLAGLQQSDAAVMGGAVFAITVGMAVYALKEMEKGRKISTDPGKLIVEGIDRSGLFTVLMETNNIAEKLGAPGLSRLAGAPPASRFKSRNILGSFIGPTAGTVQDVAVSTNAILNNDMKESDVRALRRLMPYQNVFYLRGIFDKMEKSAARELGAK